MTFVSKPWSELAELAGLPAWRPSRSRFPKRRNSEPAVIHPERLTKKLLEGKHRPGLPTDTHRRIDMRTALNFSYARNGEESNSALNLQAKLLMKNKGDIESSARLYATQAK